MASPHDALDPSRSGAARPGAAAAGGRRAGIGAATAVRGQISAREDLWIDGQFEGEVQAMGQQVTVGAGGRVRAEVKARAVVVEGELNGTVIAEEQATVRVGGRVHGEIRSPRVVLEDGCFFQGTVDMENLGSSRTPAGTQNGVATGGVPSSGAAPASAEVPS